MECYNTTSMDVDDWCGGLGLVAFAAAVFAAYRDMTVLAAWLVTVQRPNSPPRKAELTEI